MWLSFVTISFLSSEYSLTDVKSSLELTSACMSIRCSLMYIDVLCVDIT